MICVFPFLWNKTWSNIQKGMILWFWKLFFTPYHSASSQATHFGYRFLLHRHSWRFLTDCSSAGLLEVGKSLRRGADWNYLWSESGLCLVPLQMTSVFSLSLLWVLWVGSSMFTQHTNVYQDLLLQTLRTNEGLCYYGRVSCIKKYRNTVRKSLFYSPCPEMHKRNDSWLMEIPFLILCRVDCIKFMGVDQLEIAGSYLN